jgi:monothiol glutaredoxin
MTRDIQKEIDDIIKSNDIVLFMKGTSDFPMCGFSGLVVKILQKEGAIFKDINVLDDNEIREGIKIYGDWPTIPQLYVKGEFIGGSDIVKELFETGELSKALSA